MTDSEKLACLTGRPCNVCNFRTENGCTKWACVFEEESEVDKGEWIPVIERLPEIGDTVLCSVKTHESDHRIIICKYCAEEFWKDGRIRAWQPLPKPYEEETKDWVDKEMAKNYGFVLREEDRSKIRTSGAEFLEEVGGEIGSSCEKFIRQMTGNEGGEEE